MKIIKTQQYFYVNKLFQEKFQVNRNENKPHCFHALTTFDFSELTSQ